MIVVGSGVNIYTQKHKRTHTYALFASHKNAIVLSRGKRGENNKFHQKMRVD